MNAKRALLAAAAAAFFTAGVTVTLGTANADSPPEKGKGETVNCMGVNGCKGQTDCANPGHDCSGKNECKGKGWKKMTAEECEKAKAGMKS
jgi:uncharacterized membrane protein